MKYIQFVAFSFVIAMFSCSGLKITSAWKAQDVSAQKYEKIMVLGLLTDENRQMQESMENHLVGDLRNLGYDAVSAYKQFGPKAFDKSESAALDKLQNSGIDAVLTVVLLDKTRERRYVPANIYYSPFGYYSNRFWLYRSSLYRRIYEPGYYAVDTKYFWESNFYDMSDQHLVYSVQTESFDPENMQLMAHEYGKLMVNEMVKNNVLIKKNTQD